MTNRVGGCAAVTHHPPDNMKSKIYSLDQYSDKFDNSSKPTPEEPLCDQWATTKHRVRVWRWVFVISIYFLNHFDFEVFKS